MRNEMYFFYHCNEFDYIHEFVNFLVEIFYDTLEYDVLDNNIYLYLIDLNKFLLLVCLLD